VSVIAHPLAALPGLPPWLTLALVFLVPALEASSVLGVLLPGQSALIAGGVLACHGRVPVGAVLAAAVGGGAFAGPMVGYAVGHRWGRALLARVPGFLLPAGDLARAERLVSRLGGAAFAGARFVGPLRTLVPLLSGALCLPRRHFVAWSAAGGAAWAACCVLVGFAAGSSSARLGGRVSEALTAAVLALGAAWLTRGLLRTLRVRPRGR
jgi:undecaprenyl-diphosphatase